MISISQRMHDDAGIVRLLSACIQDDHQELIVRIIDEHLAELEAEWMMDTKWWAEWYDGPF